VADIGRGKIFVFGASGHAKVVIDILEKQGEFEIAFLVDDDLTLKGQKVYGYRVMGGRQELLELSKKEGISGGIVAIGSNVARDNVAVWLNDMNFHLVTAIHPSAQFARGVKVGVGTVVMAGAVVNPDSTIGANVIINTKVSVDHDCIVGDCVHLAPGSTLCGSVSVGAGTFVCSGATIIPNIVVGSNVIVGAGATVVKDVPDNVTVVGTPARIMARR